MKEYLSHTMQERRIPGLQIAVVRHGQIVLLEGLGVADIENGTPVNDQTVFPIASVTKAFTGVALLQLVESGQLDLAAPVSRYLDGLPPTWRAVTIRQLATHISGLPELVNNDTGQLITGTAIACAAPGEWDAAWERAQTLPIESSPGEKYSYNQTNYILLGKIITRLSGIPFTQFITDRQFSEVGMPLTAYGDDSVVIPHRARSYSNVRIDGSGRLQTTAALSEPYDRFAPFMLTAVGLNSSAGDMARWIIALQGGKLLHARSSLDTLWTPSTLNDGKAGTWGIGWPLDSSSKHRELLPFGGAKAAFAVYPDDDLAIVILTNLQGAMPERFVNKIAAYYVPGLE